MSLPEFVNAIVTFTYDTEAVRNSLIEMNPDMDITDEDVMSMILDWIDQDTRGLDYVLQDENGEEL